MELSKMLKLIVAMVAGRPSGRHWHLWEQTSGIAGSSDHFILVAGVSEKIREEDRYPGPRVLGAALASFRISRNHKGQVSGWGLGYSSVVGRDAALDLLFKNYPWTEVVRQHPESENYMKLNSKL